MGAGVALGSTLDTAGDAGGVAAGALLAGALDGNCVLAVAGKGSSVAAEAFDFAGVDAVTGATVDTAGAAATGAGLAAAGLATSLVEDFENDGIIDAIAKPPAAAAAAFGGAADAGADTG